MRKGCCFFFVFFSYFWGVAFQTEAHRLFFFPLSFFGLFLTFVRVAFQADAP
jgi:hypothetical protein